MLLNLNAIEFYEQNEEWYSIQDKPIYLNVLKHYLAAVDNLNFDEIYHSDVITDVLSKIKPHTEHDILISIPSPIEYIQNALKLGYSMTMHYESDLVR